MKRLRGAHPGETITIVGCGPSILALTAADIPAGPVIVINNALPVIRALRLPNLVYSMQKDGCVPHRGSARVPIRRCICPSPATVPPVLPEVLLLSAAESSHCFRAYPRRHVFDVVRDFRLPWHTMSAVVAVRIAGAMGARSLVMLGHDAFTSGRAERFDGAGDLAAYQRAGARAEAAALAAGMAIEFR